MCVRIESARVYFTASQSAATKTHCVLKKRFSRILRLIHTPRFFLVASKRFSFLNIIQFFFGYAVFVLFICAFDGKYLKTRSYTKINIYLKGCLHCLLSLLLYKVKIVFWKFKDLDGLIVQYQLCLSLADNVLAIYRA